MAATFQYAAGSGASIYGEETGDGPPVLALPGLGGGAWFFAGLARRLSPGYRLVSLDLPGTGRSPAGAAGFTAESWTDDLADLLAARISRPAVIVGHSLGTILALRLWQTNPQHVRALVFVGGLPEARPAIRERLARRAEAVAASGLAGWGGRAAEANFARATFEREPEMVAMFERLFELQAPQAYVRCCEILLSLSAASVPPTVTVPCLAISGDEDQYAPPDLVEAFARSLSGPASHDILSPCGHLPFLELADAFAARLRSFLTTVC